jgi:predicted transcriptional regulator with HTH domain
MIITYKIKSKPVNFRVAADIINRAYCTKIMQYNGLVTLLNNNGYTMFTIASKDIILIEK